ncbi:MAG: gliding motility-associated protein GldE [Bacteroidota bacterium]|nr:gliding motility-associated protein GldE [Bacteroidota bacterium]
MDPDPPSSYLFLASLFQGFDPTVIPPFLILLVLLILSALVSGSEVAFFSLKPTELEELRNSDDKNDDTILKLLDDPKRLLATILINNNFINVAIVIVSALITDKVFDFEANPLLGFIIDVLLITFLILLFGEVIPKVYATINRMGFARFMAVPTKKSMRLLVPLSNLLIRTGRIFESDGHRRQLSVDDLEHALELTDDKATTDEEHKILRGIVRFGSTTVKQIMKPRMDVVTLEWNDSYEEVLDVVVNSGYSRIPVYLDSFDHVKGVLYIKDLLPYIEAQKDFDWKQLLRDPFFVPETKKIDDLLKEFQHKRVHLAIVVDEFGGTSGIVTLEDVIEEIVGDISDEFDDEELVFSKLDNYNYVFEGKTSLMDFVRVLNIDGTPFESNKGESDTLAGFILEISGKFPEKNEVIEFPPFTFKVESLENRRIQRIKVTINEEEEVDEKD